MITKRLLFLFGSLSFVATAQGSTQAHFVQFVQQASTVTTMQSPEGSSVAGTGVPLTISVVSTTGVVVATGTAVLSDGGTVLGNVPIVNGTAAITENLTTLGPHQFSACFTGADNFLASCSVPLPLNVIPPYTLQQSSESGSVIGTAPFVDNLSVIPAKGFSGTVQLSCQVQAAKCTLTPSIVNFLAEGGDQAVKASFIPLGTTPATGFILAPLLGLLIAKRRRKLVFVRVFIFLCGAGMLFGLAGCHGLSYPIDTSIATMKVSAISGSYSQAVTYQITITP
jgi:hypothetical protein